MMDLLRGPGKQRPDSGRGSPGRANRIGARQKWKCRGCGHLLPATYQVDHIKELADGGSNKDANLEALCPNCHAEKTEANRAKRHEKWIRARERKPTGPEWVPLLGGAEERAHVPDRRGPIGSREWRRGSG